MWGRRLYLKYIKKKLFSKILLGNIAVIVATIAILVVIVTQTVSKGTEQKEINFNTQILESVKKYYEEKQRVVKQMIQQIYYTPETYSYIFELLEPIDTESLGYMEKKAKMDMFLYSNFIRDTDIANIAVYSRNNDKSYLYSSNRWDLTHDSYFKNMDWFGEFNDNLYGLNVTPAYRSSDSVGSDKWVFTIGANLKSANITRNSGILLVNFNAGSFKRAFEQYEGQIKGVIYILDKQGRIIYDSSGAYSGTVNTEIRRLAQSGSHIQSDDSNVINILSTADDSIIAGVIPKKLMFAEVRKVKYQIYIAGVVCVILSILLNFMIISLFSKRIKTIVKAIQELPQGNMLKQIELMPTEDEMGQIAFRFNIMQARLIEYINEVYVAEIKYKNAEFAALQSQIKPHFLSNTLEAIRMKAIKEGNEEVADMVYILSTLFRNTLKTDKIVKIKEEIKHCELYLKLLSYRYRDQLQVKIEVDKDIMNDMTGKLLLQPIVENSVFHGFDLTRGGNRIEIRGRREDGEIVFIVEDNGKGIEPEKLEQLQHKLRHIHAENTGNSIGLLNVHERIKFMFGERYGVELSSSQSFGTTVTIRVPELKKEDAQLVQHTAG